MDHLSTKDVVSRFLTCQREMYAGGDLAPAEELLAEEIVWHVPGTSPIAGDYRVGPHALPLSLFVWTHSRRRAITVEGAHRLLRRVTARNANAATSSTGNRARSTDFRNQSALSEHSIRAALARRGLSPDPSPALTTQDADHSSPRAPRSGWDTSQPSAEEQNAVLPTPAPVG
jgi:ketosteroid isomerase-like protein